MNKYILFFFFFVVSTNAYFPLINTKKYDYTLFSKKQQKKTQFNLYQPKNINQTKYQEYLNDEVNKIIISTGPAGTGKTLFACQKAITQLKNEEIDKIILTRPIVTIEEDIGFLPGSIIKKMDPWTKPIFDIFLEHYSKSDIDYMLATCKIEICPLVFMRGRTFKNCFIIADEMQNSSPTQMKMLTTRIGDNSRMVITGDLKQTDILKENGLFDLITRLEKHNDTKIIKLIKFEDEDIERSEIVKEMIQIYSYNLNETLNIENKTTNTDLFVSINNTISYNSNNDAALMPKHHMSDRYYDIFFKFTDF